MALLFPPYMFERLSWGNWAEEYWFDVQANCVLELNGRVTGWRDRFMGWRCKNFEWYICQILVREDCYFLSVNSSVCFIDLCCRPLNSACAVIHDWWVCLACSMPTTLLFTPTYGSGLNMAPWTVSRAMYVSDWLTGGQTVTLQINITRSGSRVTFYGPAQMVPP